jgi:peptidoglycan hydrolase-like protein with peptidoglycan-binding domain
MCTALLVVGATSALAWSGDNDHSGDITRGDRGPAVVCAQQAVIYTGGSVGSSGADGDFGSGTYSGVRSYQSRTGGLTVDGKVGYNTGGAMATDIRQLRLAYHHEGDRTGESQMVNWLTRCVVSTYKDNSGRQIFH